MKQFLPLLLAASTINAHGQCFEIDMDMDSASISGWVFGAQAVDDGVVAGVFMSTLQPMNSMILSKADTNGTVLWQRFVSPSDPNAWLTPYGVIGTTDNGLLAFGDVAHITGPGSYYFNQFAMKLDAYGCTEWSRLFMVHAPSPGWWHETLTGMVELSSGDFRMDLLAHGPDTTCIRQMVIDAQGQPTAGHSYSKAHPYWTSLSTSASDGGTHLIMSNGTGFTYNHFDPAGSLITGFAFEGLNPSEVAALRELSNGDLIFMQETRLVRIDPSGTVVWAREYGFPTGSTWSIQDQMMELAQGELLWLSTDRLLHLDGNGTPIESWENDPDCPVDLSQSDAGFVMIKQLCDVWMGGEAPRVRIVHATSLTDLVCGMTSGPLPASFPISCTVSSAPGFYTGLGAILKGWDFAMSTGCDNTLSITDLVATLTPGPSRPGFSSTVFVNIENVALWPGDSMEVVVTIPSPLTVVSVLPPATSIAGNTITWSSQAPLNGFGWQGFQVAVSTPADPQLIGTQIIYGVTVSQDSAEASIANNTFSFTDTIVGAYDPNDKLVRTSSGLNDAEFYPGIDEWLDYMIRFQNTGTDTAFTVVVTDTLPAELSTGTLNILSASHPYTYEFGGNGILRFTFNNILLPDSNVNESLSHGLVSFRIQPDDGLVLGTTITNNADIFFDFNPPIRTPNAVVTISMPTTLPELHCEELLIYPVPVREVLIAQLPEGFAVRNVIIRGSDGRLVRSPNISPVNNRLDVGMQGLLPGLYVLSVEGVHGQRLTARFVKE